MKSKSTSSTKSFNEYQPSNDMALLEFVTNDLKSVICHAHLTQEHTASCYGSIMDFILARHLQSLSRPSIRRDAFQESVRATMAARSHRDALNERKEWHRLSNCPKSFVQRLKQMIAANNIVEVIDATLVAKNTGVSLDGAELLKLAIVEKIKKERVGTDDYAVIRFLIDIFSLDVSDSGAMSSESAMDCARRSGDAELVQLLQEASGSDTHIGGKVGSTGLPARFAPLITRCVTETRSRFKKGESILSHAYVGNTQTGRLRSLPSVPANDAEETIRKIAEAENADFILMVSESWSVTIEQSSRPGNRDRMSGNLFAPPSIVETCTFKLETAEGFWLALAEIKQKGKSKKGRTFNEVVFTRAEQDSEGDCPFYRAEADRL